MKPPPFDYSAPETLEEALSLLEELGDEARPLAGGQSLVPLLALRLARPSHLVDLAGIAELGSVRVDDGHLVIGAMVRERVAERDANLSRHAPLLADALPLIGHPAIRSRGTIGGSLAHADPAAELPAAAVVLGAVMVAQSSKRGQRSIPADEFFTGFLTTALEPDEVLTEIRIPNVPTRTGTAFAEVARRHGDFAMVGVAGTLRLRDDGTVEGARLAVMGVAEVPVRVRKAEDALIGSEAGEPAFEEAAATLAGDLAPPSDVHASSAYRKHVAGVLTRRVLTKAADRSRAAA